MEAALVILLSFLLAGYWTFNHIKVYNMGVIVDMGYNENAPMERTFFLCVKFADKIYNVNVSRDVYYSSRIGQNFAILI